MTDEELLAIDPLLEATGLSAHIERRQRATLLWRRANELRKERNDAAALRLVEAAQRLRASMEEEERRKPNVSYRAR
jgi:hypothetical protein